MASMTHVEARQVLVEQCGVRDLVTDAVTGDYSNKTGLLTNATYYLNAGLRWLGRRWAMMGTSHRYVLNVAIGDYAFDVPNVNFIRRIDYTEGTCRKVIYERTIDWIRNNYRKPYASNTAGCPQYWAYNTDRNNAPATDAFLNGDFTDGDDGWTADLTSPNLTPTYASGHATLPTHADAANVGTESSSILQAPSVDIAPDDVVTIVVVSIGTNTTLMAYFGTGDVDDPSGLTLNYSVALSVGTNTITVGGSASSNVLALGTSISSQTLETSESAVIDSVSMTLTETNLDAQDEGDILFMPPADKAYTVSVFGDFRADDLDLDSDTNFWLLLYPELVIWAARIFIERDIFRNVSGSEAFSQMCDAELERIRAENNFARISGLETREAARRG